MSSIPFCFSKLHLDRQAHHYSATQTDSFFNEINGPELDVANTVEGLVRDWRICAEQTLPFRTP